MKVHFRLLCSRNCLCQKCQHGYLEHSKINYIAWEYIAPPPSSIIFYALTCNLQACKENSYTDWVVLYFRETNAANAYPQRIKNSLKLSRFLFMLSMLTCSTENELLSNFMSLEFLASSNEKYFALREEIIWKRLTLVTKPVFRVSFVWQRLKVWFGSNVFLFQWGFM